MTQPLSQPAEPPPQVGGAASGAALRHKNTLAPNSLAAGKAHIGQKGIDCAAHGAGLNHLLERRCRKLGQYGDDRDYDHDFN